MTAALGWLCDIPLPKRSDTQVYGIVIIKTLSWMCYSRANVHAQAVVETETHTEQKQPVLPCPWGSQEGAMEQRVGGCNSNF
jgi:hypothetical protein